MKTVMLRIQNNLYAEFVAQPFKPTFQPGIKSLNGWMSHQIRQVSRSIQLAQIKSVIAEYTG